MKKLFFALLTLSILLAVRWPSPAQGLPEFQVIVHADNPVTSLERTQVSKLLLKTLERWDSGVAAEPVDMTRSSPVRKAFSKKVHQRSVGSVVSYWQRQIFSGRDAPPPEFGSDAEVVAFIRSHPGGIGYVSTDASLDGVKVLTVTE